MKEITTFVYAVGNFCNILCGQQQLFEVCAKKKLWDVVQGSCGYPIDYCDIPQPQPLLRGGGNSFPVTGWHFKGRARPHCRGPCGYTPRLGMSSSSSTSRKSRPSSKSSSRPGSMPKIPSWSSVYMLAVSSVEGWSSSREGGAAFAGEKKKTRI